MQVYNFSSHKEKMTQIKLTDALKYELADAIMCGKVSVFFDKDWKYPDDDTPGYIEFVNRVRGGSQKTIPLLDMLFNVERTGGYILKIKSEDLTSGH